ncbi:MAG: YfcE family phosphodiesterase [Chloroflexi bacterium]|nr:YfcE family phosphodiesterase [Chloroflexota bacterium]
MRLAILSDIHDNIWKLDAALPQIAEADAVIFCGDLCSPFTLLRLAGGAAGKPVHVVWGNNEGDVRLMLKVIADLSNVTLHGQLAELDCDGLRVAVNHYPEIARGLAASGWYDLVCYGHDHKAFEERLGDTVLLNPGEMMGMYGRSTFAVFDTATRTVTFVEIQ